MSTTGCLLTFDETYFYSAGITFYCACQFLFLQENPSEEDAAIVDKVLSMRLTKKEVSFNTK